MILKAKYKGPFPESSVPGFAGKTAAIGEEVAIRIPDGHMCPGCWEITEGLDAYNQALEAAEQADKAREADQAKKAAAAAEQAAAIRPDKLKQYLAAGEADHSKPAPVKKAADKKGGSE